MQIRPAILQDVDAIMQMVAEVVPVMQASGNFQWDHRYPNPEVFSHDIELNQLWVADVDGEIAGVAAITTDQYPEYEQAGLDVSQTAIVVHRLAVSPRHHGKGIAVALMQQAEAVAVNRSINILRVDTNAQNKAAQTLFPKVGYTFAGEITLEFRPGLAFLCYQKILS